jgi:hypothetical protein
MCHVITRHSRELDTRAYDYKIAYGTDTVEVARRLAEQLELDLPGPGELMGDGDVDDPFSDVTQSSINGVDFSEVEQVLRDQSRSEENAQLIKEICDDIREERKEQNRGRRAQVQIEQAMRKLTNVKLDEADPDTYGGIETALEVISNCADELLIDVRARLRQ